jgi:hypothetical protein
MYEPIPGIGSQVRPPEVDPNFEPDWTVCFNSDWLPIVLGALGQIVDSSLYITDDDVGNEFATERANNLMNLFTLGCTPPTPTPPNWFLHLAAITNPVVSAGWSEPGFWDGVVKERVQEGNFVPVTEPVAFPINITFEGFASGPLHVGGLVDSFIIEDGAGVARAWTVTVTDCFDADTVYSGLDAHVVIPAGNYKTINVIYDTSVGCTIEAIILNDLVCEPA